MCWKISFLIFLTICKYPMVLKLSTLLYVYHNISVNHIGCTLTLVWSDGWKYHDVKKENLWSNGCHELSIHLFQFILLYHSFLDMFWVPPYCLNVYKLLHYYVHLSRLIIQVMSSLENGPPVVISLITSIVVTLLPIFWFAFSNLSMLF